KLGKVSSGLVMTSGLVTACALGKSAKQVSISGRRTRPIVLIFINGVMVVPLFFPAELIQLIAGPDEAKNHSGTKVLRLIRIRIVTSSFEKISPVRQAVNVRYGLTGMIRHREHRDIPKSPLQVPKTQSACHPHAQRNA